MNIQNKMMIIEDCMDLEEGTLRLDDNLADYEEWDSLTMLSMIAVIDEKYHKTLTGEDMKRAKTVIDIIHLMN